jgi:cytochrome P450
MSMFSMVSDEAVNAVLDDSVAHPTESADLLNVLFGADNGTWPRKRVRDEALTFMLAGHETTANAMSWLWYLLASNPDARDKMLAEIDEVLGGRRPTADDIIRLSWTSACVQESQRHFSAVWIIARETVEDDVIDGHHIRPGTTVLIPIHHIHHDERWWPDPETFDPTRFIGDAARTGPGRHICRSADDASASGRASR